MKTFILVILLSALSASAQSVSIRVIANDGAASSTNVITAPAHVVQGLLITWNEDSASKTNQGRAKLKFADYVAQEIDVKNQTEWAARGSVRAIELAGATNPIPPKLLRIWPTMTAAQKTNAVNFINQIGP